MLRWLTGFFLAGFLALFSTAADPPTKPQPTRHDIPYRLTDTKHVLVRAKLNGKGPYNFILDTGAPAVFIPKKLAKDVGLELDKKGWGQFNKFEVEGGLTIDKTKTRVEDLFQLEGMNNLGLAGVELHGVIGYNVLAQFRITYDFAADKLIWESLDFTPPPIQGIGRSGGQGGLEILGPVMKILAGFMGISPNFEARPRGFLGMETTEKENTVYVKHVLPDGPAAKAGLKAGDKIVALGIATAARKKPRMTDIDTPHDLIRALAEARVGDQATIQIRRGEETETIVVPFGKGL